MSHLGAPDGSVLCEHEEEREVSDAGASALDEVNDGQPERSHHDDHHHDDHDHDHDHDHGLVDRSILRSHEGVKAVALGLLVLGVSAAIQIAIFAQSGSVTLLADWIHNFGDALTAIPLGIALYLRSVRGERLAGLAVVLAIFVSACVALYVTIMRFIHRRASPASGCWPPLA